MLTIKGILGLGFGLLPANCISPLIPTLFPSLIFPYSSAAPLRQAGSLFDWSRHLAPEQGPEGASSFRGFFDSARRHGEFQRENRGQ